MPWSRTAIAVVTSMVLAVLGCATRGRGAATGMAAASAGASSGPSGTATAHVTEAAFNEDADGARLVLSSDAPLVYTAYEPRPDLLVVDLPGIALSKTFAPPTAAGTLVTSLKIESVSELGKQMTRVTVAHREGARFDVRTVGQGLAVAFDAREGPAAAAETVASTMSAELAKPAPPVSTEEIAVPRGELAHALEEIRASAGSDGVTVSLLGDGVFAPKDFVLENPPRLVIDLPGVKNEVRRRVIPIKSGLVTRVRVSQFQSAPDLTTRVVLDLVRPLPHAVRRDGERISIVVGASETASAAPARVETPSVASASSPSRTRIAPSVPAPPDTRPEAHAAATPPVKAPEETARPAEALAKIEPAPKPAEPIAASAETKIAGSSAGESKPSESTPAGIKPPEAKPAEPKVVPPPGESQPIPMAALDSRTETPAAPAAERTSEKAASAPAPRAAAAPSSDKPIAPPPPAASKPAPAKQARRGTSPSTTKGSPREEALFEAAAAVLQQEEGARPEGTAPPTGTFQPRTISESQNQFTGEPISLDLKDADIKDVFRTISQLTQLNIVVDPEVRGTVTVQLEDVPWDQALDLILKQNGLGYVLENNIMRIATTAKLQAEQADRARLAEARQSAEPTRTVIKKLSYARASEITPSLKSVMSKRGDIVVDGRTNTLIIREIPTYLPAVLQLIENLDTATPQVMIESRIVETTKSLGRSLGINWGFNGAADVAHGNPTGLSFPNVLSGGGRVGLQNGPTVVNVRLGNILDTFNLDLALTAAENQGLLKIISSPKVAALTNTAASIQSGVQIPVQTNVNNTTTVIYVDATLKLTVTPQITNEGTILLDVSVSKREPAVALNLSLGQNVPLTVREYKGQILVRDGGTTVIGGIFQINDQDQNNMIPGLWKIPILGNLFRNKTRTEKHDELLIFITPRILR